MKLVMLSLGSMVLGACLLFTWLSSFGLQPVSRCAKILAVDGQIRSTDADTIKRLQAMLDHERAGKIERQARSVSVRDREVAEITALAAMVAPKELAIKDAATRSRQWVSRNTHIVEAR